MTISSIVVVTVNFSETVYTVGEGDGQAEVCAVLTGQTARSIAVIVSAQFDTASGKNYNYHNKIIIQSLRNSYIPY